MIEVPNTLVCRPSFTVVLPADASFETHTHTHNTHTHRHTQTHKGSPRQRRAAPRGCCRSEIEPSAETCTSGWCRWRTVGWDRPSDLSAFIPYSASILKDPVISYESTRTTSAVTAFRTCEKLKQDSSEIAGLFTRCRPAGLPSPPPAARQCKPRRRRGEQPGWQGRARPAKPSRPAEGCGST